MMASLLLAIGGGSAVAQTWEDYTSKITNPSFEADAAKGDLINGWNSTKGWTITPSSAPKSSQVGIANAKTKIQGIGTTFKPSAGDKFFYLRCNWQKATEFKVSQTISNTKNLPVGTYKLTCKVANFSSAPSATNYRLSLGDGTNTATNKFSYNEKNWGEWSIIFYKSDASKDLTIEAYMKPGAEASNQHYSMLLDDFKLEYLSDDELAKASSENPLGLTAAISNSTIYNPTKTSLPKGWSENRKAAGNNNRTEKTGDSQLEGWSGDNLNVKYYQTLTNLPTGKYVLKAKVHDSNEKGAVLYATSGTDKQTVKMGKDYAVLATPVVSVINGNLEIGIDAPNLGGTWMTGDDFTLSYVGLDLSALETAFSSKKAEAGALLGNADYKNITGDEKTELESAKNQNPEETKNALEAAINKLESAISAFTSAKSAYDNYAEEAAVAEKFGLKVEAPATAAAATKALKTLNVAEYNAATNDYTTAIKLGEWTTTGASKFSNEHWSGETRSYLNQDDSNNQGWNSNSWTMTCKQTLTLPAGEYVFKAAGRKSANAFMKLSVKNGETLIGEVSNFPNGNVGLGITTDGKASFDSNDKFANNNNGRGWQWRFVPFTLDDDTQITFDIEAGADVIHNWASFGDYTVMAKPSVFTSTAAYNQAVDNAKAALTAEANKVVTGEELTNLNAALSADKGTTMESIDAATKNIQECTTAFTAAQPKYQALVDAKTLEQTKLAYASEEKYTTFTTSKEATATTAADAETKANAIISAHRAYVESNGKAEGVVGAENCTDKVANPKFTGLDGQSSLEGWTRTQSGGNEGALNGEIWTNADANKGYYYDYYNGGANNQHVYQEVANLIPGKYIVTIKARAQAGFNLYLLINDEKKVDINEIGSAGGDFERGWNDYTTEFTVGADGKVKIEVANMPSSNQGGWFGFGDVRLVRLGDLDAVTLDEAADNVIEAKEAANVTLKRKFVANKWNTLVLPFAVSDADVKTTFGADAKIVEYSNAEDVNINFTTSTNGIKANVPVLIKLASVNADNTYSFDNVNLEVAEPKAEGTTYSFVGSYKSYNLVNDDYMLYGDKWWKTEAGDTYKIKAFRAYIKANTPAAAKQLNLVIDGQTTGLKLNTVNGNIEGETYNIAGQRVANSYKGLVIKNGKKIIKK